VADEAGQVRQTELDPEAEARRRLALAQIRQYPDPALRMTAREVTEFDEALVQLAARMLALMIDANGVGLAGTQVGVLQRLFTFQLGEDETAVVVNPSLSLLGSETQVEDEGCLSLQRVLVPVERSLRVRLAGKDERGADVSWELEGVQARVAQHELDHLDGVLIIDRTTPEARRGALATLRAQLSLV
jgi:peptide deformylase